MDKAYLESAAIKKECARKNIDCYHMPDGRKLYLLAEGRLVNLAAGDGHPAEIMDTSFALQLLTARYIAGNYKSLENRVYNVPEELDMRVAQLKLESMGVSIDKSSHLSRLNTFTEQRQVTANERHFDKKCAYSYNGWKRRI